MHIPVLLGKIREFIRQHNIKTVIDLTFGAGGHSKMFLEEGCRVFAIDRDINTEIYFKKLQEKFKEKIEFSNDLFSNFDKYYEKADLIFGDLGLSTMQLEEKRGFAFMEDSNLDMRMGCSNLKLSSIINKLPRYKIEEIIKKYGEERNYKKISYNIDIYRIKKNITTTFDLKEAIGFSSFSTLARVFQSFRIYLNNELEEIKIMIEKAKKASTKLILMITFHSLEDRIIKNSLKNFAKKGFLLADDHEILENPKSRSAKLRFAFMK